MGSLFYYYFHRREVRPVEREEVEKMMSCKGLDRGCYVYQCPKCGTEMEFVCEAFRSNFLKV
ncbi:MAG TPA: transposase zinc-binding domain-containing protein [Candidatus Bathyarchaeia archaeon]|nr:transposase zinc-binding domain-containing protein [Candidatus Bathyarchaeia archaeon]